MNNKKQWPKYLLVFLITATFFSIAWYLSLAASREKLVHLQTAQDKIATDILSSETQFDLLQETSCEDLQNTSLGYELDSLADKISYAEKNFSKPEDILVLKKQYSILEVKDFLLVKRIGEKCKQPPILLFYFYANKDACSDCVRQGYVLDVLRQKYPTLRVYSFDYNLDLSTIKALTSIYKIQNSLPGLVINGKTFTGFKSVEEVESLLPKDLTNPTKNTLKKN